MTTAAAAGYLLSETMAKVGRKKKPGGQNPQISVRIEPPLFREIVAEAKYNALLKGPFSLILLREGFHVYKQIGWRKLLDAQAARGLSVGAKQDGHQKSETRRKDEP